MHNVFSFNKKKVEITCKNIVEITKTISNGLQFIDSTRLLSAHYQSLPIILLKEFIKLDLNTDMIKNVKL